jgi:ribosomal protein L22
VSTPGDPQKGKAAEAEQIEQAAEESTEALAQEEAAEAAEAPKPKRRRAKSKPEAEGTAAAETGIDKDAAEAEEKPKRRRARKAAEETIESPQAMVAAAEAKEDAEKPDHSAEKSAPTPAAQPARRRRRTKTEDEPEPPSQTTPGRRRGSREPGAAPPVVRAQARYVRSSARKARLVCDHLRGKSVPEARAVLAFSSRAVARDWSKVLESAIANAENNHDLVGDELRVVAAFADEGPTLKRFRPRAMGRATRIRKRTSHLTIKLTPTDTE